MLVFSSRIKDSLQILERSLNLYTRSKDANNLRDKISRGYYACYHACIAAILLKEKFNYDPSTGSSHKTVRDVYKSLYSPKKGQIVKIKNYDEVMKLWKTLRESADYEIFTKDFEEPDEEFTKNELNRMYSFVNAHVSYVKTKVPTEWGHDLTIFTEM